MIRIVVCLLLALCSAEACHGQEAADFRRLHPWGHFQPGAWKRVRVITKTFERGRILASVTRTKTTLQKVDDQGVTLKIEVELEVGGKHLDADPQTVTQGYLGEISGKKPVVKDLGQQPVTIGGREITCQVRQIEFDLPTGKTVTKVYYCPSVDPYVLRRETLTYGPEGGQPLGETTVAVKALEEPCRVCNRIRTAARVESLRKTASGTTSTRALVSSLVPGGVICHTSEEVDNQGRLVRRSQLDLIDFGLQPEEERTGLFRRRRPGRKHRGPVLTFDATPDDR